MTPSQTRRRGRLYRYYICLGASRRGHDTCPVRSIAASEVEGLVLGQIRRLLASPELGRSDHSRSAPGEQRS
jgi:site-specific DNA recombinase